MAEKHVITFSMIHEFFQTNNAQLKKGENAYTSKHVERCVYDGSVQPPLVNGKVLASMKKKSYSVEMILGPDNKTIDKMTCDCPRGEAVCHHMAAFAFHAHYNISVTDQPCTWSVKKCLEEEVTKFRDIYPSKPFTATTRKVTNEEVSKFRTDISNCHVVGFSWLLRPEAESAFIQIIPNIEDILFSQEYLDSADKSNFFCNSCKIDYMTVLEVEQKTVGQFTNENWLIAKKHRLTASRFGTVLNAILRNKFPPSLFKTLLGSYNLDKVMAVQWGREHESVAIKCFEQETGLTVTPTGLWLDMCGFLGASPDGLIGDDSIIEVKCPYKFRDTSLDEALQDKKYIVYYENDEPIINGSHIYYNQIQGQLYFCNRSKCYLVIWTPKEHRIYVIEKNAQWQENIPLLKTFYVDKVIPYICSMTPHS